MRAPLLVTILALLLAASSAHAATGRAWSFTSVANVESGVAGTFSLAQDATGGDPVDLPAGAPVTWADPHALAAPAPFSSGDFTYDLRLARPAGSVTLEFGYLRDGVFSVLATSTAAVQRDARTVVPDPVTGVPLPLDVGRAQGVVEDVSASYPAGSYPAVRVVSDQGNALYTQGTLLGAEDGSAASVPLPELSSGVLFVLGAAAVLGVAGVRARKAWK